MSVRAFLGTKRMPASRSTAERAGPIASTSTIRFPSRARLLSRWATTYVRSNSKLERMFSFLLKVTCLTSRKQFSENRQFWLRNLRKFENLADVDLFRKISYLKLLKSRGLKIKIGEFWTTIEKNCEILKPQ